MASAMRRPAPAAVALLLLLATAAGTLPRTTHAFSLKPTTKAAQSACSGLDRVQIPDPDSTTGVRNYYYVCCGGEALRFQCMVPSSPSLVVEYSDARDAKYNPLQGQCERMDERRVELLYERAASAQGKLRSTSPVSSFRAIPKSFASDVCAARLATNAPQTQTTTNRPTAAAVTAAAEPDTPTGTSATAPAKWGILANLFNLTANPQQQQPVRAASGAGRNSRTGRIAAVGGKRRQPRGSTLVDIPPRQYTVRAADGPMGSNATTLGLRQATGDGAYQLLVGPDGRSSTGTTGIHATFVPGTDDVLFWGRLNTDGSNAYEPGMVNGAGQALWATRYNTNSGAYTALEMPAGASFCSGHSYLSNGNVVAATGDVGFAGQTDGRYSIRQYDLGAGAWVDTGVKLPSPHWYPTQLTLPDDRVIIMGGYEKETGPSNPTWHTYNAKTGGVVTIDNFPFLVAIGSLNLYPGLHLLPWSNSPDLYYMMAFNCDYGEILTINGASAVTSISTLPGWPGPDGYCSQTSSFGAGTLLMLKPENGYAAEYAMFGGTTKYASGCDCDTAGLDKAYRIKVDQDTVLGGGLAWDMDQMPRGRNLNNVVLLPNGKIILINGAYYGRAGTGEARDPAVNPWYYDPDAPKGQRFRVLGATTNIARYYHGNAMLLPDGAILVAGSDQDSCVSTCYERRMLRQVQAERFLPPYFFEPYASQRPSIVDGTGTKPVAYGETTPVAFTGTATGAVLMAPAAVTHQNDMNSRAIKLVTAADPNNAQNMLVTLPGSSLVAPPGYYMMFLLNGDIPCTKAQWVRLG